MTREIPLVNGRGVVLVDDDMYDYLVRWRWFYHEGYAARKDTRSKGKRTWTRMHRLIMNVNADTEVDHRNRNKLDNRRCNLRLSTRTTNNRNQALRKDNSSGYKGVYYDQQHQKWRAHITVDKRKLHLGRFADPVSAAHVYDKAALHYFGEFAYINFGEKAMDANPDDEPGGEPWPDAPAALIGA